MRLMHSRCGKAWLALALPAMLTGCVGAAVIPLLASGPLFARHHVKAATPVPGKSASRGSRADSEPVLTSLKQLPAPTEARPALDDPWQKFFTFALAGASSKDDASQKHSALLTPNPSLVSPDLRDCPAPAPAVVIDLDPGTSLFDPQQLGAAPAGVAEGLARLRTAGIVVLWISQLPASRAADVARALQTAHLDPAGTDQLLLVRSAEDRKQLLREDALADVCIVAIAGDARHDFDELFDYLRHPEQAAGLDAMLGSGWFLVPPLEAPPAAAN